MTNWKYQGSKFTVQDVKKFTFQSLNKLILTVPSLELLSLIISWSTISKPSFCLLRFIIMSPRYLGSKLWAKEAANITTLQKGMSNSIGQHFPALIKKKLSQNALKQERIDLVDLILFIQLHPKVELQLHWKFKRQKLQLWVGNLLMKFKVRFRRR